MIRDIQFLLMLTILEMMLVRDLHKKKSGKSNYWPITLSTDWP